MPALVRPFSVSNCLNLTFSLLAPANGVGMKIWQCFDGLPAQQWFYTDDNRIALENQGQCLDLTNGSTNDGTIMQIWACTDQDTNQVWTLS